ncbi:MAG: carboxy terminal-processing peptidase [Chitinophagaceae bacterium]|nr:carboxy terminal-processing peptidase [Chitinophagaceae bacterium]
MVSKRGLPIVLLLFVVGVFGFFKCRGNNDNDSLLLQQKLLSAIAMIIEQRHYSPKKIDDNFSQYVFTKFINTLDGDKSFFLQSDIDSLKIFQNLIDDEIMSRVPMRFFPTSTSVYLKNITEIQNLYPELLSQPFDFNTDEKFQLNGDLRNYPKDAAERRELWRKRLKYEVLDRFVELQDQRDKAKADSIKNKTDAELEQEARTKTRAKWDRYFKRFTKTFKEKDQYALFVNTITQAMDPHTEYFGKQDKREFDEQMSNHFYGIGALLGPDDDYVKIVSVIPGSPAWKSGKIHPNDIITKVGQGNNLPEDIAGFTTTDAVKIIRGNKGTEVRLYIKKALNGQPDTVSLIRDDIVQDESAARSAIIHENGKKIGYIWLPEFYADFQHSDGVRCANDVANEIKKLKQENIDGLIIDLKSNPGGSLFDVVQMVGLFIKSGPVVQVRDRDGSAKPLTDDDNSVLYTGPLTVMVNEFSASASEIFAAAIQDYKRGIVVGSTSTYGKGTVQRQLPLGKEDENGEPEYGSLKLTFEKFYRINGGSTQLRGVVPDIIIPDSWEKLKAREKDNPNALAWDKIEPATYTPWQPAYNTEQVVARSEERIKQNKKFNAITRNTDWFAQNEDREMELNIAKYKAMRKEILDMSAKDDSIMKLKDSLHVSPALADNDKFYRNPDEAKGKRYQEWLKSVRSDIYINETVKVMNDMLGMRNSTAQDKNKQGKNPLPATLQKSNSIKK